MTQEPRAGTFSTTRLCPLCGLESDSEQRCPNDGATLTNPFEGEPDLQDKYQFLGVIGSGGMGVIYKARLYSMNQVVAIKMMHAHLDSQEAYQRFQIEGKATALLSHPFIVGVRDFGSTTKGQPFMVMDYVDGQTLSQVLAKEIQIGMPRFIRIFSAACEALAHAHKRGVLHRDIKPSNIMLIDNDEGSEEVRIMDFGIAKITADIDEAGQHLTKTGEAIGSPTYMSPEQARGAPVDVRSDLYSVGCVMYETLTGAPPFVGATPLDTMLMHLNEKVLPLKEASLGREIDSRLEGLVLRLLQKDPNERVQSMEDLHTALDSMAAVPPITVQRKPISRPKQRSRNEAAQTRKKRRSVITIAMIVLTGIAISIGGLSLLNRKTKLNREAARPPSTIAQNKPTTEAANSSTKPAMSSDLGTESIQLANLRLDLKTQLHKRTGSITVGDIVVSDRHLLTKDLMDLFKSGEAQALRELELQNCGVQDTWLESLNTPKLETLDLSKNPVSTLQALPRLKRLTSLNLDHTQVGHAGLATISHLQSLETLSLKGLSVFKGDLEPLKMLKSLKTINLDDAQIASYTLAPLATLPRLETLTLTGTTVTAPDLLAFSRLKSLKKLDLRKCQKLTPSDFATIKDKLVNRKCELLH